MKAQRKQPAKIIAYILALCLMVAGSAGCNSALPAGLDKSASPATEPLEVVDIEDAALPLSDRSSSAKYPVASGIETEGNSVVTVDSSNKNEGYVMIKYSGSVSKIKVQITKSGSTTTYTYNLNSGGKYEVFPLTCGNGTYTINVYENISGNQYALAIGTSVSVSLNGQTLPFLYPSQYINYTSSSKTVAKGAELAKGTSNELALVSNVYNYCINNITYDYNKAASVKAGALTGYLPTVDTILSSGTGICFDYAAVMAAMLRSQGVPTQLQIGYVSGGIYHAWVNIYVPEIGWINSVIYFDGTNWKLMDPTFASGGSQNNEILKFIGDGSNYSVQYIY